MSTRIEQSPDAIDAVRILSRLLFGGGQYRLEIGAAIARAGEQAAINTSVLAEELELNRQSVNQELRLLEQLGLLRRLPNFDSGRKVYFIREPAPYWDFCEEIQRDAGQMLARGRRY
jgi:predicted transcriptional regulator